ncbi:spindle pole body component 110-like [Chelonus insularis]|uniref:spindle pole body component 110-like n=1 Tax=Chelonus insularis TaxID=460826 RepID=UPI0015886031|nr:spindle pole body component 110-like [Chelonus insularis]
METTNENDEKPRIYPNNVQRTMYEIRITDIQNRIERTSKCNEELTEMIEETTKNLILRETQTADEIAQLNGNFDTELNKANASKNAINMINKQRVEEKKIHEDKVNSMKDDYEATRLKFMSKIKILRARINALEDFKVKEPALRLKLEAGETLIREKDENLKEELNRLEVKFKIDREKLILDLRKNLFELSKQWESDRNKRQGTFVRKLFDENINLHYELDHFKMEKYDEVKHLSTIKSIEFRNKKTESNINKSLQAIEIKKKLISKLIKRLDITEQRRGVVLPLTESILINHDSRIEKLRSKIMYHERKMAELMVELNKKNIMLQHMRHLKEQNKSKIQEYLKRLHEVKCVIASALQMTNTDTIIGSMTKTQFIIHLL